MTETEVEPKSLWQRIGGPVIFALVSLAVIWGVLPWLPADWGVHFGAPYLIFFSLAVLGAGLFFSLLNWGPIRQPRSPLLVFVSITLVYAATVGGVMSFGVWYYPQFELPQQTEAPTQQTGAIERGMEVFSTLGCFACHSIEAVDIRGGTRGPDLSALGEQAQNRKPGMSADDYLRESIVDPVACLAPLPDSGLAECQAVADAATAYPPLMPPGFEERMSAEQLDDLIAFLKSLKGAE